jgi:hypothetical protein
MKLIDRRAECGWHQSRAPLLAGLEGLPGSRGAFGAITTAIFKITVNARIGSCDPEWK